MNLILNANAATTYNRVGLCVEKSCVRARKRGALIIIIIYLKIVCDYE